MKFTFHPYLLWQFEVVDVKRMAETFPLKQIKASKSTEM